MNIDDIIKLSMAYNMGFIVSIFGILWCWKKAGIFPFKGTEYPKEMSIFMRYTGNGYLWGVILFAMFFLLDILASIPLMKDLPQLKAHEYETVSGYAVTQSIGGHDGVGEPRNISIQDENTGEIVAIECITTRISKGTYIVANYLANSHYATIVYRD